MNLILKNLILKNLILMILMILTCYLLYYPPPIFIFKKKRLI